MLGAAQSQAASHRALHHRAAQVLVFFTWTVRGVGECVSMWDAVERVAALTTNLPAEAAIASNHDQVRACVCITCSTVGGPCLPPWFSAASGSAASSSTAAFIVPLPPQLEQRMPGPGSDGPGHPGSLKALSVPCPPAPPGAHPPPGAAAHFGHHPPGSSNTAASSEDGRHSSNPGSRRSSSEDASPRSSRGAGEVQLAQVCVGLGEGLGLVPEGWPRTGDIQFEKVRGLRVLRCGA